MILSLLLTSLFALPVLYKSYKIRSYLSINCSHTICVDIIILSTAILVIVQNLLLTVSSYNVTTAGLTLFCLGGLSGIIFRKHSINLNFYPRFYDTFFNKLLCLALLSIVITSFYISIVFPPIGWDSLLYHYLFPAFWVQDGKFATHVLPPSLESYSHFPFNGEIFSSWLILIFHGYRIVNIGNFIPFFTLFIALYCLSREHKLNSKFSLLFSSFVTFSKVPLSQLNTGNVDLAVGAWMTCALLYFIRYYTKENKLDLIMLMLSCSLAIGAKLTIIPYIIFFITIILLKVRPKVEHTTVIAFLISTFIGSYWYVKNFIETSNPVYPFKISFLGKLIFEGSHFKDTVILSLYPGDPSRDFYAFYSLFQPKIFGIIFAVLIVISVLLIYRKNRVIDIKLQISIVLYSIASIGYAFTTTSTDILTMRREWPHQMPRFLLFQCICIILISFLHIYRSKYRKFFQTVISCYLLFVILDFYLSLNIVKQKTYFDYLKNDDSYSFRLPGGLADGLNFINSYNNLNIAYYAGYCNYDLAWFMFPFMGTNLQNRVNYVEIFKKDKSQFGDRDFLSWKKELLSQGIDTIVFQFPWIPEIDTISKDVDDFNLVFKDSNIQIFTYLKNTKS